MNVVSEVVDSHLLRGHTPEREKVYIEMRPESHGLELTLRIPLDSTVSAEADARRFADVDSLNVRYKVSRADVNLEDEVLALRRTFETIYKHAHEAAGSADIPLGLTQEKQQELLSPLAAQGASLFHRLFRAMELEEYTTEARVVVRSAVLSALARNQAVVVRSSPPSGTGSHAKLFPWPLLYDDPDFVRNDRSKLDPRRFWGFRHEIQHDLPWTARERFLPRPSALVVAICPDADRNRHGTMFSPRGDVRIATAANVSQLQKKLEDFGEDMLYFFGHGGHDGPPVPSSAFLEINNARLFVSDLEGRAPKFQPGMVLLFLNSCFSAPTAAVDQSTMAGFLGARGDKKVCCVATIAAVPESVGVEFARAFWPRFLGGALLGVALREARLSLLEAGSPLGLLYDLYGRLDTRITPEST